jgi:hypothetical protein
MAEIIDSLMGVQMQHSTTSNSKPCQDRSDALGEMLTAFFAPPVKPSTDRVQK